MNRILTLLILSSLYLTNCGQPKVQDWKTYIGTWQSTDDHKLKIRISQAVREGQPIEERYDVVILDEKKNPELPEYYLNEGYYYFKIGPSEKTKKQLQNINKDTQEGLGKFVIHPFDYFMIHTATAENPDKDAPNYMKQISVFTYIGLLDDNTIQRKIKGLPDVTFTRLSGPEPE